MEKIIIYNVSDAKKIIDCASEFNIQCSIIGDMSLGRTIESIANSGDDSMGTKGTKNSLVIFCGLSEKHLDGMLKKMKEYNINVDFKATMTPTNRRWTLEQMIKEMQRERFEYMRRGLI